MEKEIWKDILGYDGIYKISNLGQCFSIRSSKILKLQDNGLGYKFVILSINNKQVKKFIHRLVLENFIGMSELECNHIDGNKSNNNINNLEYLTRSGNILHRNNILGFKQLKGKNNVCSKSVIQYNKQGDIIKIWECIKDIERELNIFSSNITRCCKGKVKSAGGYKWIYNLNN